MSELRLDEMGTQDVGRLRGWASGTGRGDRERGGGHGRRRGTRGSQGPSCHFLLLLPQHGGLFPSLHHTCRPSHGWASTRNPLLHSPAAMPSPFKTLLFWGLVPDPACPVHLSHRDSLTRSTQLSWLSQPEDDLFPGTWSAPRDQLRGSRPRL